jgi:hypothetical protein
MSRVEIYLMYICMYRRTIKIATWSPYLIIMLLSFSRIKFIQLSSSKIRLVVTMKILLKLCRLLGLTRNKSHCQWPPFKGASKIAKAIKSLVQSDASWPVFNAKCLKECGEYRRHGIYFANKWQFCSSYVIKLLLFSAGKLTDEV